MRKRSAFAFGLSLLLGAGGWALAQGPDSERPGDGGPRRFGFEALDENKDGKLSRDEFPGPDGIFDRMDENKDGSVSREEMERAHQEMQKRMVERLKAQDEDKDGKVSRDEFEGPPGLFDRIDANKDGSLSTEEIENFRPGPGPGGERPGPRGGERPGPRGERPGPRGAGAPGERFNEQDKDNDGKLSRDEFRGPEGAFDRMDENKDGFLSREEIRDSFRRMMERREGARGRNRGEGNSDNDR